MISTIFVLAAVAGLAAANGNYSIGATGTGGSIPSPTVIDVTTVVTSYTTYCPSATTVVQGNQTYTATEVSGFHLFRQVHSSIQTCPLTYPLTGDHPDNHQLPMHTHNQDHRHPIRNHNHRGRHILHNLLSTGNLCHPEWQDLHRNRIRDSHNH